jgi:hypothetical protein
MKTKEEILRDLMDLWEIEEEIVPIPKIYQAMEDYRQQSTRELESRNKELEQALMSVLWMWQIANKSHYDRNTDAVNKFKSLLSKPGSTELKKP